jgi:hypothetical protein
MRKLLAILKLLIQGRASIVRVGKTRVSISPGEVTQIKHN